MQRIVASRNHRSALNHQPRVRHMRPTFPVQACQVCNVGTLVLQFLGRCSAQAQRPLRLPRHLHLINARQTTLSRITKAPPPQWPSMLSLRRLGGVFA